MTSALPHVDAFAAMAAQLGVCAVLFSAVGVGGAWLLQSRDASVRHTAALSTLIMLAAAPFVVTLHQTKSPRQESALVLPQSRPVIPQIQIGRPLGEVSPGDEHSVVPASGKVVDLRHGYLALLAIWMFGSVWRVCKLAGGWVSRHRFSRTWRPVQEPRLEALVDRLCVELGIRRSVVIKSSSSAPWAFTLGVLHPVVVLPDELAAPDHSSEALESVLLHELAHVRRLDYAVSAAIAGLRCLYWWNPLLSQLIRRLVAAREEICDSHVLMHRGNGEPLAEYLVTSIERSSAVAFGVGALGNPLRDERTLVEQRIRHLMLGEYHSGGSLLANCVVAVGAAVSLLGLSQLNFVHSQRAFLPAVQAPSPLNDGPSGPLFMTSDGRKLYHSQNGTTVVSRGRAWALLGNVRRRGWI